MIGIKTLPGHIEISERFDKITVFDKNYPNSQNINRRIRFAIGNSVSITKLKIDAIVNAAAIDLQVNAGKGGICQAIYKDTMGMGPKGDKLKKNELSLEDYMKKTYNNGRYPEKTTVLTDGYSKFRKHIIHVIATQDYTNENNSEKRKSFIDCYNNIFINCNANNINMVAIPCLGSRLFGGTPSLCAKTALQTIYNNMKIYKNIIVVICLFDDIDVNAYKPIYANYFQPHYSITNFGYHFNENIITYKNNEYYKGNKLIEKEYLKSYEYKYLQSKSRDTDDKNFLRYYRSIKDIINEIKLKGFVIEGIYSYSLFINNTDKGDKSFKVTLSCKTDKINIRYIIDDSNSITMDLEIKIDKNYMFLIHLYIYNNFTPTITIYDIINYLNRFSKETHDNICELLYTCLYNKNKFISYDNVENKLNYEKSLYAENILQY